MALFSEKLRLESKGPLLFFSSSYSACLLPAACLRCIKGPSCWQRSLTPETKRETPACML